MVDAMDRAAILIVDDQEANILLLEGILDEGGYTNYRSISDSREVVRDVTEHPPDLILLDLAMPYLDGFAVMEQLRPLLAGQPYLPILVLTADINPEVRRRALASGAKDFLSKPLDAIEVLLRIKNLLETRFLYLEQQRRAEERLQEQMEYHTRHDRLTGLPNRTVFQSNLPLAMAQARGSGHMLALFFLDLDHFKILNDSLGHARGDALLCRVAERLQSAVRETDVVARLGGDEFAIVQTDVTQLGACVTLAERIVQLLSLPIEIDGQPMHTSVSIGITVYPADGSDPDQLVKNADLAMYRAKNEGGNTSRFFSAEMNAAAERRLTLERELRLALERNEFLLHYQPQVDRQSRRLVGAEALLRWQHPGRGLLGSGEFIGVAEDSGMILPIGELVLRQACAQNHAWRAAGRPCGRVAVNVSTIQFQRGNLVSTVLRILEETGLDPHHLEIELTESGLLTDFAAAVATLTALHERGVQIAIDDFGTGYSSLNYLKRLPVDRLKIDRSFVQDVPADPSNAAIVRAIIQMGHSLGLRLIAEGVETEAQRAFLAAEGCDEFQGFLFGRPMPAEAVIALMS